MSEGILTTNVQEAPSPFSKIAHESLLQPRGRKEVKLLKGVLSAAVGGPVTSTNAARLFDSSVRRGRVGRALA